MDYIFSSTFIFYIKLSIVPSILFILMCLFYVGEGMSVIGKFKLIIRSCLLSYTVLVFVQMLSFYYVDYLLISLSAPIRIAIQYLHYFVCNLIFSILMAYSVKKSNEDLENPLEPKFGFFLYVGYLVLIYSGLIFAQSEVQFIVYYILISVVWDYFIKKDVNLLARIYSNELFSVSNITVTFELIVIMMLWFLPLTYSNNMNNSSFSYGWLSGLSVTLYIFTLCIHFVVFNEAIHRHNEIVNLSTDGLSTLYTREYFLEKGQDFIFKSKDVAVIFINIGHFRYYNQKYGDSIGDEILINLSAILKEKFENNAIISRLSDDHFGILTDKTDNLEDRMEEVGNELSKCNEKFTIQLRVGINFSTESKKDIHVLLDGAVSAEHNLKASEQVSVKYYDKEVRNREKLNNYILTNLDRAISENLLEVFYQPIVNIETGKIDSAEALIRWQDDQYGFLTPDVFVPLLEENNLIYKIDCYVLEQICKDHIRLKRMGLPIFPVGFNISRRDFLTCNMVTYTEEKVRQYHLDRKYIKIEITESSMSQCDVVMADQIEQFGKKGYKVWMDDFGSGYSSLNTLGDIHFDGIKIDMIFLRNLTDERIELMRSIVQMAHNLNLDVMTEGVEEEKHLTVLNDIGCNKAQGYYFSKPYPLDAYLKEIEENHEKSKKSFLKDLYFFE